MRKKMTENKMTENKNEDNVTLKKIRKRRDDDLEQQQLRNRAPHCKQLLEA